jgi:hypothetical protein
MSDTSDQEIITTRSFRLDPVVLHACALQVLESLIVRNDRLPDSPRPRQLAPMDE